MKSAATEEAFEIFRAVAADAFVESDGLIKSESARGKEFWRERLARSAVKLKACIDAIEAAGLLEEPSPAQMEKKIHANS